MNRSILIAVAVVLASASPWAMAKEGTIVQGENGTKWCCPNGEKGPHCEKSLSNGTPVGARCNFASLLVPVGPSGPVKPSTPSVRGQSMAAPLKAIDATVAQPQAAEAAPRKGE